MVQGAWALMSRLAQLPEQLLKASASLVLDQDLEYPFTPLDLFGRRVVATSRRSSLIKELTTNHVVRTGGELECERLKRPSLVSLGGDHV